MRQARILLFLGIVSLLVGLSTRNGTVIALSFCPLLYVGIAVAQRPETLGVEIDRTIHPSRVGDNEPVTITLTVTNTGSQRQRLLIHDHVPSGLTLVDGVPAVHLLLGPAERATYEYSVQGLRGSYGFENATAKATELFGLFGVTQTVSASKATLLVTPKAQMVGQNRIHPERTRGFAGPIPARVGGAGVDFLSLREYQPGDKLRTINWRVTERRSAGASDNVRTGGALYSNVFEQQRIADIGFILDSRRKVNVWAGDQTLFEFSVQATQTLAASFLDDGHRVGLLVYGSGVDRVAPGSGREQKLRITHALSRATPGTHFVFDQLENLPARVFAPTTQLLFIGPVHREDLSAILSLRGRGYAVLVVSPSPLAAELLVNPISLTQSLDALALQFAEIERANHLNQLRRKGIVVVDWDLATPLREVVRQAAMANRGQRMVRSA
jgi:uncharacterized protein (DUF58 family)